MSDVHRWIGVRMAPGFDDHDFSDLAVEVAGHDSVADVAATPDDMRGAAESIKAGCDWLAGRIGRLEAQRDIAINALHDIAFGRIVGNGRSFSYSSGDLRRLATDALSHLDASDDR